MRADSKSQLFPSSQRSRRSLNRGYNAQDYRPTAAKSVRENTIKTNRQHVPVLQEHVDPSLTLNMLLKHRYYASTSQQDDLHTKLGLCLHVRAFEENRTHSNQTIRLNSTPSKRASVPNLTINN